MPLPRSLRFPVTSSRTRSESPFPCRCRQFWKRWISLEDNELKRKALSRDETEPSFLVIVLGLSDSLTVSDWYRVGEACNFIWLLQIAPARCPYWRIKYLYSSILPFAMPKLSNVFEHSTNQLSIGVKLLNNFVAFDNLIRRTKLWDAGSPAPWNGNKKKARKPLPQQLWVRDSELFIYSSPFIESRLDIICSLCALVFSSNALVCACRSLCNTLPMIFQ